MHKSLHIDPGQANLINFAVLQRMVAPEQIRLAFDQCGIATIRIRKLCLETIVWLLIAINLFVHYSIDEVFDKITLGLITQPNDKHLAPGTGALAYRRSQLGARPMVALFHQVCRPLATIDTPGSFRFGCRLMAIDGQVLSVPDTKANAKAFGRGTTDRGPCAYAQIQAVYLQECGTHAIVDAGLWPYRFDEEQGAKRLVRSIEPGMLVLLDRGLYSLEMIERIRKKDAHVLARLPDHVVCEPLETLPDGSQIVQVHGNEVTKTRSGRRYRRKTIRLRLVRYTFDDPNNSGHQQTTRIVTTIEDYLLAPAKQLAIAYHQRWEIELTADEIETHQHPNGPTLRSKTPVGIAQEFYGLLLAHYIVRKVIYDAAQRHRLDTDQLSFVHSLRIICESAVYFQISDPSRWPQIYENMLDQIRRYALPPRTPRANQRAVKRKMSNFPLKRGTQPGKRLKPYDQAISVI